MTSVERRAIAVSERRAGLATDQLLVAAGISERTIRRRVARGEWRRIAPGVVEVRRAQNGWPRRVWEALLAAGPGATVSHRSAAALHGLGGIKTPLPVDITVPRPRRSGDARVGVHTTIHPVAPPVLVRGLPVTPVPRTLRDLAVVVPSDVLSRALHDALRRGTTVALLRQEASSTMPGAGRLRRAIDAEFDLATLDVESPLEAVWVDLLRTRFAAGMVTQHVVQLPTGRRVRVDIAWPADRVAVEVDGARWHADATARARDRERHDLLVDAGWTVVHVTAPDLEGSRHDVAMRAVAGALARP